MAFEPSRIPEVEKHLGDLVRGTKGVRDIRGCSDSDLGCYRISFGYQRRDPLKNYLLIFDPNERTLTVCADGGIGNPPSNVRQRLLDKLGSNGYKEGHWDYSWSNIGLDSFFE